VGRGTARERRAGGLLIKVIFDRKRKMMKYREYERGIRLSGLTGCGINNLGEYSKRGVVKGFSEASRKRLGWVYEQGPWVSMLTFTYHNVFPHDFKESKRHLQNLRKYLRRRGILNLWVLEWQRRGFPHYHVWLDRRFDDVPLWEDNKGNSWRPIMRAWLKITSQNEDQEAVDFSLHGLQYTDWQVRAGSNYACKYAYKMEQKGIPGMFEDLHRYGRWWGCSRGLVLEKRTIDLSSVIARKKNKIAWNQFRRQTKRFIEKKYKFTFPRDKIGSLLSIRWTMTEERVNCINRFAEYYLPRQVNCVSTGIPVFSVLDLSRRVRL